MISEKDTLDPKDIIGKNVTFSMDGIDGEPRYFNGFVNHFSYFGRNERMHQYYAEVVPWLWFLTQTTDCRIFQNKSVPDIIKQIFGDLGFTDYKLELKGKHEPSEYCVQYAETDFDFVSRLMEEEGIFYFFKHEQGKHTMVLADDKGSFVDAKDKEMQFGLVPPDRELADNLGSWEHRYEFRPGKEAHTYYIF